MENETLEVRVHSPSRLHFSLIDMHGSYSGRADGGAGLAIKEPGVRLIARPRHDSMVAISNESEQLVIDSELQNEITTALHNIQSRFDLAGVDIEVHSLIRPHSGLGSKTQFLMSCATAYCRLNRILIPTREIACLVGRGGTSGIGVEAFNSGGFVVDCGHSFQSKGYAFRPSSGSRSSSPGPLVGRYDFPGWPILVVTANARQLHGLEEQALFDKVCPIPLADAQACAHIVLMMLIPAVIEGDLQTFCKGINLLQVLTWKSSQIAAQGEIVKSIMDRLLGLGLEGVGMSSWGPTVYGFGSILENEQSSQTIIREVQDVLNSHKGGVAYITMASNCGAVIKTAA